MTIVSKVIRFLLSLLISGMLLAIGFGYPAIAATRLAPVGQLQTPAKPLDIDKSTPYTAAELSKIEKSANEVQSLRSCLEAFQPAIEQREWPEFSE